MGPIFRGAAAVCLVALSGLQPAAGDLEFSVEKAGEDAYTSVNLARVGQMSVRIGVLTENSTLVEGLDAKLQATASEPEPAATCDDAIAKFKKTKFVAQLTGADDDNYRQAVQDALTAGLEALPSYPEDGGWTTFWTKPDGANLAHLLSSNSTKVGCAVGTCTEGAQEYRNSPTTVTFLVCQMDPAAEVDKAPFE
ncbi:SAG family member [Eimeria mitis]|uniref:SAG family member n=1 Tax=Eimeria mitis TaxID=44415 RepID=U6K9N1_9EIME|nr:SAG family member [Eimeria mitis]CDJ32892.1 SAG family member [Eimeria mitis]